MKSRARRLPQELIDAIIDYLHDNKRTLRSCTLVCKTWIYRARFHLFSRLEVTSQDIVERLIRAKYVIPFIRHIYLQPSQINLQVLPRVGFENIQSLTLMGGRFRPMDDPVLSILCNTFSSVVTLEVRNGMFDNLASLVRVVCAFSHLRTLDIYGDTSADLPTSLNLSTHLRHLILGGRSGTCVLEWFTSLPDRPALRTLNLGRADEADLDNIVRVHSLLEDTLESLSFAMYKYSYGGTLSVFIVDSPIDLRCMGLALFFQVDLGRICSLRIRPKEAHRRLIRWLARILSRISSIHMDEIVLELLPSFTNSKPKALEWRAMDTVLQQQAFSRLNTFKIRFLTSTTTPSQTPAGEQSQFYIDNLPQCNARGILCIRLSHIPS